MAIRRMDFDALPRTPEHSGIDSARFRDEVQAQARPAVMRGLVAHWPACDRARAGDAAILDYLRGFVGGEPVDVCLGGPDMLGRFFYDPTCTRFNFERRRMALAELLDLLARPEGAPGPRHVYAGAVRMQASAPGFVEHHPNPLVGPGANQLNSLWIGGRTRIAAHWDLPENLICAIAGRRRYVLFPPDQLPNLYCGPLDVTPAGQPVSLVDFAAPDFARFPGFAEALRHAEVAELGPGDVLYLPSLWWHHAESLDAVGVMVNTWWREVPGHMTSPRIALLHALMTIRDLPAHERAAWRAFFDHYVFRPDGADPATHIPFSARGVLGEIDAQLAAQLRAHIVRSLSF